MCFLTNSKRLPSLYFFESARTAVLVGCEKYTEGYFWNQAGLLSIRLELEVDKWLYGAAFYLYNDINNDNQE